MTRIGLERHKYSRNMQPAALSKVLILQLVNSDSRKLPTQTTTEKFQLMSTIYNH